MILRPASQKNKPKSTARYSAPDAIVAKKSKLNDEIDSLEEQFPKDMRVIGMTGDVGDSDRNIVVELEKAGNTPQRFMQLPLVIVATADTRKLIEQFAINGYFNLPEERGGTQLLAKLLLRFAQQNNVKILNQPGLSFVRCNGGQYKAYVWGNQAYWFGNKPDEEVLVINSTQPPKSFGTLESWQKNIGANISGNPRLIVIICHAISASLRKLFNRPYTAIALVGKTSRGKSTCQQVVQSLIGEIDDVKTMVGSEAGVTKQLAGMNDVAACFQDTRQFGAENLMKLLFSSVDGATRMVMGNTNGSLSAILILSNEKLLADMKNRKESIDEGIYARLLEITFPPEAGVFDDLHGAKDGAAFSERLKEACQKDYGTLWPAWINVLSDHWVKVLNYYDKWIPKIKSVLIKRIGESTSDPVTNRLLNELVFSAFAGGLAVKFGILTLSRAEIIDAFALVMKEYLARKWTEHSDDGPAVVAAVRGLLDEKAGKFPKLKFSYNANPISEVFGYSHTNAKDDELILFLPSVFERLINKPFKGTAYNHLKRLGFLVTTKDRGNQYQARIPGTDERKSFVAIRKSIIYDPKK